MRARWHWRRKSGRHGGNRAQRRRRNKQSVLGHDAARKTWLGWFPSSETFLNLCCTKIQDQLALGDIEEDRVTVTDRRDGAAIGGVSGDVSGYEAVRGGGRGGAEVEGLSAKGGPLLQRRGADAQDSLGRSRAGQWVGEPFLVFG